MGRLALAGALAAGALAGCGVTEDGGVFYAGIDEGEVPQVALESAGREVRAPDSPLYRHKVQLGKVTQGENSEGDDAWVVRIVDATARETICVRLWAKGALNVRQYYSEVEYCTEAEEAPTETGGGV